MRAMASAHAGSTRVVARASRADHGAGRFHAARLERKAIGVRWMRAPSTAAAAASPRAAASSSSASSSSAPPLAVGDDGGGVHGARVRGRGVCRLESGFVLLCDRATPGETVVARVTGVKGGGGGRGAGVRPRPSPHVGVPVPALRGMRRVHVAGRIVRRAAGHEARAGAGRVAPNRKGFAAKRRWGDASSARWKRDANARSPLDASALCALVPPTLPAPFTARYRNKMEFAFAASPRPENGVSVPRRAPRPAPAGRPRRRRRGHLRRRRRPPSCSTPWRTPCSQVYRRTCGRTRARPRRSRRSTDGRARVC